MINFIFKIFFCLLLIGGPTLAADATLLPDGKQQFFDANGNPLTSGKVYFYIPNTLTFKTTWQNAGKTIANTNPVDLDAAGRAIIYGDGTYRQIVKASNGNTIWDALTASTGSSGGGTLVGDGNLVSTILPWSGLVAPNQYVFAYGQEISRATYPEYFTAVTYTQTVTCSSGTPTLSGLADTTQIPIGAVVELNCVAPGTTVIAKALTTITLSANSSLSTSSTATFFPYGNGNGSTTFNVIDLRGRVIAGRDNMGGTAASRLTSTYCATPGTGAACGAQSSTLITANLPPYTPTGTVPITDPGHDHAGNAAWLFDQGVSVPGGGGASHAGGVNTALRTVSNTTGITAAFTGVAQGGVSTAFANLPPTMQLNYVVKVTPDVSSSVATGVASIGGMTGVIACGSGIVCTGNIISAGVGSGTVTSVGLTGPGGIFSAGGSPITISGTLTLTTSGTSGGISYFSNGSTLSSSALLILNRPVVGGGSGGAPSSMTALTTSLPLIGDGSGNIAQGTRSGNTTIFGTTSGALTTNNCLKSDASGNIVDAGSSCGAGTNAANVKTYVASSGDFTPGTTTSLVLTSIPTNANELAIMFDGIVQAHNTYSLATATVTFSAAIPLSVQIVEAQWSSSSTSAGVGSLTVGATTLSGAVILAAGPGITLTTASQTITVSSSLPPGGRLTVNSGSCSGAQSIQLTSFTSSSLICYVPHNGNSNISVNGVNYTFSTLTLQMNSSHQIATNLYDIFAVVNAGSIVVCFNGTQWAAPGSSRGVASIVKGSNGLYSNDVNISNCWNNATDYGPISIGQGLYLGTIYAVTNGTTQWLLTPDPIAGGTNNVIGLYNAYNRINIKVAERDLTSTWTWSTLAGDWNLLNSSANNRITIVDGLGLSQIKVVNTNTTSWTSGTNGLPLAVGMAVMADSITIPPPAGNLTQVFTGQAGYDSQFQSQITTIEGFFPSAGVPNTLGLHYFQCLENGQLVAGVSAATWYGNYASALILEYDN